MPDFSSGGEIDKRVDRLLRNAAALRKFPTPIDDIIDAQKLTVSTPEDSPLAPGMIARAPAALRERLDSVMFKVLAALDRRERVVHVHPETRNTNHDRFNKLHEVGHDLCVWQDISHAVDGRSQLDPSTTNLFEREANYAGARLLFQGDVFVDVARSFQTGLGSVLLLSEQFGGSIHAAFHQYVATHLDGVAGYILRRSPTIDLVTGSHQFYVKMELASDTFTMTYLPPALRHGGLSSVDHSDLESAWRRLSAGENVAGGEMRLQKHDGSFEVVNFELFSNTYNLFLLLLPTKKRLLARPVRIASTISQ